MSAIASLTNLRTGERNVARTWVATGGRQSGRTTREMQAAPKGAVFVWVSHHIDYPRDLAHKLGRYDLKIVGPEWLTDRRWMGLELSGIQLDHAAQEIMTREQWREYQNAITRVRTAVSRGAPP